MIRPYHRILAVALSVVMTVMPVAAMAAEADLTRQVEKVIARMDDPQPVDSILEEPLLLPEEEPAEEEQPQELPPLPADGVYLVRNGEPLHLEHYARIIDRVTYVPVTEFFAALDCNAWWDDAQDVIRITRTEELSGQLKLGSRLAQFNGRCWMMTAPCAQVDGMAWMPLRDAAKVFNGTVTWVEDTQTAHIDGYGLLEAGGSFYDEQDLLWIARIVRHEAGNQPLEGKVAVANVIINRMNSWAFPNTAEEVIFDTRTGVQFVTRDSKAILKSPSDECWLAAKLALEGYETAPDCLYFASNRVAKRCWAGRNRQVFGVIGGHTFFY